MLNIFYYRYSIKIRQCYCQKKMSKVVEAIEVLKSKIYIKTLIKYKTLKKKILKLFSIFNFVACVENEIYNIYFL